MLAMKNVKTFAFLFALTCLPGCTLPTTPTSLTGASPSLTGNWQIQSGTALTSPPTAPYLIGALQGTESALTGTFSTAQSGAVSPTVDSYAGTYNASTGVLSLQSPLPPEVRLVVASLSLSANPTDLAPGTLAFWCGLCNSGVLFPVVGAEIAPLNGTYTGTLSGTLNNGSQTTPISDTASVTFTQSTTPNSSGQFPLTGAVTFPSTSGLGTTTLPGLVSGITIELSTEPCVFPFSNFTCNVIGLGQCFLPTPTPPPRRSRSLASTPTPILMETTSRLL